MKTLKTVSTEELLKELESRKVTAEQEAEQEEEKDILHIGLIDNEGLCSIVAIPDKETFARVHGKLDLRARFNTQRNPEMFAVKIPKMMANLIRNKTSLEAAQFLKGLSIYKAIAY